MQLKYASMQQKSASMHALTLKPTLQASMRQLTRNPTLQATMHGQKKFEGKNGKSFALSKLSPSLHSK